MHYGWTVTFSVRDHLHSPHTDTMKGNTFKLLSLMFYVKMNHDRFDLSCIISHFLKIIIKCIFWLCKVFSVIFVAQMTDSCKCFYIIIHISHLYWNNHLPYVLSMIGHVIIHNQWPGNFILLTFRDFLRTRHCDEFYQAKLKINK